MGKKVKELTTLEKLINLKKAFDELYLECLVGVGSSGCQVKNDTFKELVNNCKTECIVTNNKCCEFIELKTTIGGLNLNTLI